MNAEALQPDGTFLPGDGTLTRFAPPAGRGVRVDTAAYQGYPVSPRYDSLLAKVITEGGTLEEAARRAVRALAEFGIAGVPTNAGLLQALLRRPGLGALDAGYLDAHAAELAARGRGRMARERRGRGRPGAGVPDGHAAVPAPLTGTVVSVAVTPGQAVGPGDELLVLEAMKMEHEVRAQAAGQVAEVRVAAGDTVPAGAVLVTLAGAEDGDAGPALAAEIPLDHIRPDLAEARERHRTGLDEGRPEVTERRHARRAPDGPGEHRRPGRRGQLHRVRRAGHRGPAPPPRARRPHRPHPGGRPGPGHRAGRRAAGRGDVLRLHRAGRHARAT